MPAQAGKFSGEFSGKTPKSRPGSVDNDADDCSDRTDRIVVFMEERQMNVRVVESKRQRLVLLAALVLPSLVGLTGCQVDVGGQTLPSPYWLSDDVQYFAPGPEFKLAKEAAAMQQAAAEAGPSGGQ